jgi:hypothetical protein
VDYRQWPRHSSGPPREEPAGWTASGHEHGPWSAWHGPEVQAGHQPHRSREEGGHQQPPPPDDPGYQQPPPGGQPSYDYGEQHQGYAGHGYAGPSHGYASDPYAAQGHVGDPYATHVYPAVPPQSAPTARRPARDAPVPTDEPTWAPALAWTIGLFVVPVLLYLVWAATRDGVAPAGCLDASGMPCPSPRDSALQGLVAFLPGLAGALTLAMVTVLGLRRIAGNWRPSTVALAAAVIGGGTATLIASLVS